MPTELLPETNFVDLESHVLLFKTPDGTLIGWNILTDLPAEEIDNQLGFAARDWASTKQDNTLEQNVDYATVLMKIPPAILAKYRIFPGIPIHEIIELDAKESVPFEEELDPALG